MEIKNKIEEIALSDIEISNDNVRHDFDANDPKVIELSVSIKEFGQLQPVVLMGDKAKYKLIVGQRRYYAIKHLGWKKVKAVFLDTNNKKLTSVDATVVSLAENLHRVQLTYDDMSTAISRLYDHYKNAKKVAEVIGTTTQTVYEYLKVDKMVTPKIRELIKKKKTTKEDVKRAFVIAKGDATETENVVSEMATMTGYQKNRAMNIRRVKPQESASKVLKESKEASFTDVLTINLSSEMEDALNKAKKELKEEKETIAINAIKIWLVDNKFLQVKG